MKQIFVRTFSLRNSIFSLRKCSRCIVAQRWIYRWYSFHLCCRCRLSIGYLEIWLHKRNSVSNNSNNNKVCLPLASASVLEVLPRAFTISWGYSMVRPQDGRGPTRGKRYIFHTVIANSIFRLVEVLRTRDRIKFDSNEKTTTIAIHPRRLPYWIR